jgi:hypothetical protein
MTHNKPYPARLNVDYPKKLDRLTTFFRIIWSIPILAILVIVSGELGSNEAGGITAGLFLATALTILFRQKYPRWWFDFALELNRFSYRIGAYILLLTDRYPSTEDKQGVHLNIDYPNVKQDLNRWLPLVKWLLATPHYIALIALSVIALGATIIAWFAILFTGRYPRSLFDFVVGVGRWSVRVSAYAFLLTTDEYPPFSLK